MHNDRLLTSFSSFANRNIIMFSSKFHDMSVGDTVIRTWLMVVSALS